LGRFFRDPTSYFKINQDKPPTTLSQDILQKLLEEAGVQNLNLISLLVLSAIYATSPNKYAEMLSKKIQEVDVKVWLINTGGPVDWQSG
jgi:hypothetical protein